MQLINDFFNWLNGVVWGVPMIILILGTGLYLQLRLGFMPSKLRPQRGLGLAHPTRDVGPRDALAHQPREDRASGETDQRPGPGKQFHALQGTET